MMRQHTRSKRTATLFPYSTLFRSHSVTRRACSPGCCGRRGSRTHDRHEDLLTVGHGSREIHGGSLGLRSEPARRGHRIHRPRIGGQRVERSEEHTSELQSLMRISYAVFCLKKNKKTTYNNLT